MTGDRVGASRLCSPVKRVKTAGVPPTNAVTLGLSPHSGWAALVAVGGSPALPEVLVRARIELADPSLPGSRQPYHALEELPLAEAERRLRRYESTARSMARAGLASIVDELRRGGHAAAAAGILESSGRKGRSLEAILASHALIHTADGDHFRDALAEAGAHCGLVVHRVSARDLVDKATAALRLSEQDIQARVRELGRPLGPPWTADQKSAAMLAWSLLISR